MPLGKNYLASRQDFVEVGRLLNAPQLFSISDQESARHNLYHTGVMESVSRFGIFSATS